MSTVKERPILFKGAMVRAILAGTKTQTRRALKHEAPDEANGCFSVEIEGVDTFCWVTGEDQDIHPSAKQFACPYGQPGDRLWVREAFRLVRTTQGGADGDKIPPSKTLDSTRKFEADGATSLPDAWMRVFGKLRPGIHMPRWASRITLEITSVRVERLNDISEADAAAEGMQYSTDHIGPWSGTGERWWDSARWAFKDLWLSINGADSWDTNPWVWVVEFKRTEACNG